MTRERINAVIAEQFAVPIESLTDSTRFKEDLNADSIDLVELAISLESVFNLPEPENGEFTAPATIGELIAYVDSLSTL
ncbi:MAG: phosphopantetheine-binding protein [Oscillospiraceae bacterium]|jgi:acyl carrier protein|nr:phosphopantetheine-binding protein [Oscillospiraceae bacterium]